MYFPPCRRLVAVAVVALGLAGCGDSLPRQKTYKVSGQVLLDNSPAPGVTVVFHPVDPSKFKWNERPQGKTDDQGRFSLTTYEGKDGAPAAEYKVAAAVVALGDDGGDQPKRGGKTVRIPLKYHSHETSGLTATVEPRETTLEPFVLRSKP